MTQKSDVLVALARIDDAQAALHKMLKPFDPARLRERPPSGEWSPLENVRHLIFAEQHHFKVLLEKGFRWSSVSVAPPNRTGERRLNSVGADPAAGIDEVFDAWAKVHNVVRERALPIAASGKLADGLAGNLNHVNIHTRTIERLLQG